MLINFVGCPASGKTTIAAKTFAYLKEDGYPAEYIAERARYWIAVSKSKLENLDDNYQEKISRDQFEHECLMSESNPSAVVISDSSALLTLVYSSDPDSLISKQSRNFIPNIVKKLEEGLVFYCLPIPKLENLNDQNRIHNHEQSLEIDKKIEPLFKKYAPNVKLIKLDGPIDIRTRVVLENLYPKLRK